MRPRLVYVDPPWNFKTRGKPKEEDDRAPPYPTITLNELIHDHRPITDRDAILALWVIDTHYPQALALMEGWGFEFVTVGFRWLKITQTGLLNFGMGFYTRGGGCEELWFGKKGKGVPVVSHSVRKEFYSPLREHSRKPDEVAEMLVRLFGDVPRLEMFARTKRPGWRSHGDEVEKFNGKL